MTREVFKIKNVSNNVIELKDFGIIINSGVTVELFDYNKAVLSTELYNYMLNNDIIRLINDVAVPFDNSYDISTNNYNVNYNNIIDVSKTGGTYNTINEALDSITGATSNNQYLIKVHAGTYTENIIMKNNVHIFGEPSVTKIVGQIDFSLTDAGSTRLQELNIKNTNAPVIKLNNTNTDQFTFLFDVVIIAIWNNNSAIQSAIEIENGSIHILGKSIIRFYNMNSGTSYDNIDAIYYIHGNSYINLETLFSAHILTSNSNTNIETLVYNTNNASDNTNNFIYVKNNFLQINLVGTASNNLITTIIHSGSTTSANVDNSYIELTALNADTNMKFLSAYNTSSIPHVQSGNTIGTYIEMGYCTFSWNTNQISDDKIYIGAATTSYDTINIITCIYNTLLDVIPSIYNDFGNNGNIYYSIYNNDGTVYDNGISIFEHIKLGLGSSITINEFTNDLAVTGNTQYTLPTQYAVKNYIDTKFNSANNLIYDKIGWSGITNNVGAYLDEITTTSEQIIGTGYITEHSPLYQSNYTELTVLSGAGYISYNGFHKKITWNQNIFNTSAYTDNIYYVCVNENNEVYIETSGKTSFYDVIKLGGFYTKSGIISAVLISGRKIDSVTTRVHDLLERLGAFIYDNGSLPETLGNSGDDLFRMKVTSCNIQNLLDTIYLPEVTSNEIGTKFFIWFYDNDVAYRNYSYEQSSYGVLKPHSYNDINGNINYIITGGTFSFTNNSKTVTATFNILDELKVGDYIYLSADTMIAMNRIDSISGNTLQLTYNYTGTTNSGTGIAITNLVDIPSNKYIKHIIIRDYSGKVHLFMGNTLFNTIDEAVNGTLPPLPVSIHTYAIKIASVIVSTGMTSLNGAIYDLRPLSFQYQSSSGSGGSGGVSTHSSLLGLEADDHLQYLRTDGTRNITGIINYSSENIFTNDNNLISKKYVDTNLLTKSDTGHTHTLFNNDMIILGNLTVSGVTTTLNTNNMNVKDNLIYINSGETNSGITQGYAGIRIDRGTLTDYEFIFDESSDTFRIGELGDTHPVATREDSPINGNIAVWDSVNFRFSTNLNPNTFAASAHTHLVTDITDITNYYYNQTQVNNLLLNKANTGTTLNDYNISDAYTQNQINNFFSGISFISGYNKLNWDSAFNSSHTHSNKSNLDAVGNNTIYHSSNFNNNNVSLITDKITIHRNIGYPSITAGSDNGDLSLQIESIGGHIFLNSGNTDNIYLVVGGGNVAIGYPTFDILAPERFLVYSTTDTYNVMSAYADTDNYIQINIKNFNSGLSSSSDVVATANNGNESSYFIDMGINSSTYDVAEYSIMSYNDGYLYTMGENLVIGAGSTGKIIKFFTNGTLITDEKMRIDDLGNIGVNSNIFTSTFQIADKKLKSQTSNVLSLRNNDDTDRIELLFTRHSNTNNYWSIQSIDQSTGVKELRLNPNGGDVTVSGHTIWHTNNLNPNIYSITGHTHGWSEINKSGSTLADIETTNAIDIDINLPNWNINNINSFAIDISEYIEDTMISGRIEPVDVIFGRLTTTLTVSGGTGYINYENYHRKIVWTGNTFEVSGYTEGIYFVYVDTNSNISITTTEPNSNTNIILGSFYKGEIIGVLQQHGCVAKSSMNEIVNNLTRQGVFIYDNGGNVGVLSGDNLKIISSQCKVQYGLLSLQLPELTSNNASGYTFLNFIYSNDNGWATNYYFNIVTQGKIIVDRWNDITKNPNVQFSSVTFTQYSNIVTCTNDLTSFDLTDTFVYYQTDTDIYMTPVSSVTWNSGTSTTTITLETMYLGSGGIGNMLANYTLPRLTSGKYVKHLITRSTDGLMYFVLAQTFYSSENDAINGVLPAIPTAIEEYAMKMAYIVVSSGTTNLSGNIYDIRPLPYQYREGGQIGGGTTATAHGTLSGLNADDHLQYLRTDGTRNIIGIQKYNSHPTFTTDTDLIDKKYVDDNLLLKSNTGHTHNTSDINNLSTYTGFTNYYLNTTVNSLLLGKANTGTTLSDYGITDTYTQDDINIILLGKSNTGHTHIVANISDISSYYYDKNQITNLLSGYTLIGHSHSISDISNINTFYYNRIQTDNLLLNYSITGHTHNTSEINNLINYNSFTNYYLNTTVDTLLNAKSFTGHTHTTTDINNLSNYNSFTNYYLNTTVDTLLNAKSFTGHTHTTTDITNLISYTGFTNYYLNTTVNTLLNQKLNLTGGTMSGALTVNADLTSNKYILGTDLIIYPIGNSQSSIRTWWGLQLRGYSQDNLTTTPTTFGLHDDYSVLVITDTNNSPTISSFAVIGNETQTSPLQVWRNGTQDYTASISITGLGTFNGISSSADSKLSTNLYVTGSTYHYNNIYLNGKIGIYQNTPTAYLHLPSGSTTANTAPIKLTSGINMTTPEVGAIEYDGSSLYYTDNIPLRQTIIAAAYGEMYEYNTVGSTITSTPAGGYIGWKTATAGSVKYTSYTDNTTADRLTISSGGDGDYRINFTASVSCSTTRQYRFAIFKNGVQQTKLTIFIRSSSVAIYFPVNISGILTGLVANDYIDIRVAGTNLNDSVVLYTANLSIARINT